VLGCQRPPEVPVTDVGADRADIETLVAQQETAFNEADLDAFMAVVADDAVYLPPDEPALVGEVAIRNWYDFETMSSIDVTIMSDEIEVSGDWAFHRARWTGSWIRDDSGERVQMESKVINLFKRQPDGSWKNSHSIWNFTRWEVTEI
jgi:ketosteroid isomerase-like protein